MRYLVSGILLLAARTALALTCGGFTIVPAGHVLVKYSAPLATGAARSIPVVSISGSEVSVTRTVSGGSLSDVSCVDDSIDLGTPAGGRFHLTWNDNANFTSQRSTFTFVVGSPSPGWTSVDTLVLAEMQILPPLLPDQPVRMEVLGCSGRPPVAYVSGADIAVSTDKSGDDCKVSLLDLGVLGPGDYKATLAFVQKPNIYAPSETDRFVVQQPLPSSACFGVTSVMRSPTATARLHYESLFDGYAPVFGLPSVTGNVIGGDYFGIPAGTVTVVQPVADTGTPTAGGAPPASTICHAQDLDLGPLEDGYHQILWWTHRTVNGVSADYAPGTWFDFWWQNSDVLCTRSPQVLTSSALEGASFDVSARVLGIGWALNGAVAMSGKTVTIDSSMNYFGSNPPPSPQCQTHTARVGALPAGEYTLVWRVHGLGSPLTVTTSHLTIVKPPRRRAASH
jgi:hypothetical protein